MDNLENKVGGVRLSARDFGEDGRDYSIVLEAMREASTAKKTLAVYDAELLNEVTVKGNVAPYVITKLALLRNARRIVERFESVQYNPSDEGLYRPQTPADYAADYSAHGQGD